MNIYNCLLSVSICLLSACGSNTTWSSADKSNAYNICMVNKSLQTSYHQQKAICNCYVQKLQEACPNPLLQSELPIADFENFWTIAKQHKFLLQINN